MATCAKVYLRQKPITKGRMSLYLDYWPAVRNPHTGRLSRREFLGFYIYAEPKNDIERDYNEAMLTQGELIRCRRQEQVINKQFGFMDRHQEKADFLDYFKKMCKGKPQKWEIVYRHFETFVKGKCLFEEVTVELCTKFREYLLTAHNLRLTHRKLSQNSIAGYFSTFRGLLKVAYRDKLLKENINDYLDKIEWEDVQKEYLTQDELIILAKTPCKIDVLKRASLFSCLTGLRISDIENLTWNNLRIAPDKGPCVRIRTQKTSTEAILPISYEALELCGERGEGKVFKGLTRSMINVPLKHWIEASGIKKHITFHCFRHTYATLQIAAGTDIYTVSKMLTHKSVVTTQIYADLVSSKKRETVDKIKLK